MKIELSENQLDIIYNLVFKKWEECEYRHINSYVYDPFGKEFSIEDPKNIEKREKLSDLLNILKKEKMNYTRKMEIW